TPNGRARAAAPPTSPPWRRSNHSAVVESRNAFDIRLPGLMMLNRLVGDAECGIDGFGAVSFEDAAAIAHERRRAAVLAQRRIEHREEGAEVLPSRERTGQDGAAVVLQYRNTIHRVAVDVVHIDVEQV